MRQNAWLEIDIKTYLEIHKVKYLCSSLWRVSIYFLKKLHVSWISVQIIWQVGWKQQARMSVGLRHQATLAHCQANCWTAAWHRHKAPCWPLMFQAPGWALPFALHRCGQVGRQEGTSRDSWAMWSCCDHSWCQVAWHTTPPLPPSSSLSTVNQGCR